MSSFITPAKAMASGLDDVVVADTLMSEVDGEAGRLVVRGYDIEDIAGRARFEDMVCLLRDGRLPDAPARTQERQAIARGRLLAFRAMSDLGGALSQPDAMDALKAGLAQLPASASDAELSGALACFAAAWWRLRNGHAPIAPDPSLDQAADYLRMTGYASSEPAVRELDTYLITVADHGMNASTFTARVVASTGVDTSSAILAALCALKGPLHGGAPGPVLDMLDAIGSPQGAVDWIEAELAAGRRIMGFGHRVYRVRDPRAAVFEAALARLETAGCRSKYLTLARSVEQAAVGVLRQRHPERPLEANVEFYTAVLLDAVGLPRELFSATFAVGRIAGWCAHVAEQRQLGRLIRPASRYVGGMASSGGPDGPTPAASIQP